MAAVRWTAQHAQHERDACLQFTGSIRLKVLHGIFGVVYLPLGEAGVAQLNPHGTGGPPPGATLSSPPHHHPQPHCACPRTFCNARAPAHTRAMHARTRTHTHTPTTPHLNRLSANMASPPTREEELLSPMSSRRMALLSLSATYRPLHAHPAPSHQRPQDQWELLPPRAHRLPPRLKPHSKQETHAGQGGEPEGMPSARCLTTTMLLKGLPRGKGWRK